MIVARARTQQTDKHKLVTHNLGDIGKVRGRVFVRARASLIISLRGRGLCLGARTFNSYQH